MRLNILEESCHVSKARSQYMSLVNVMFAYKRDVMKHQKTVLTDWGSFCRQTNLNQREVQRKLQSGLWQDAS